MSKPGGIKRAPKGESKPIRYVLDGEEVFNSQGQVGWRLRIVVGGKRTEKLYWGSYEQAVTKLSQLRDDVREGRSLVRITETLPSHLDNWVKEYRYQDGVERPRTTWKEHEGNINRYIKSTIERLKWADLIVTSYTGNRIDDLIANCQLSDGRSPSPSLKKSIRKTLRMAFAEYVNLGVITINPAAGKDSALRPEPIDSFVPTPSQMESVASHLDAQPGQGSDPYLGSMLRFLYFTGLRISEALALKRSAVNLRHSYISVEAKATVSGGRRVENSTTKTMLSNRHVTLLPEVRVSYYTLLRNAQMNGSEYLFCGKGRRAHRKDSSGKWVTSKKPESIGYGTLAAALREACGSAIQAGAIPEAFTLHQCRHGFATLQRSSGQIPDTEIAEEMGHASARLIQTLYGASRFDADRSEIARRRSLAIQPLINPPEKDSFDVGAEDIGDLYPE